MAGCCRNGFYCGLEWLVCFVFVRSRCIVEPPIPHSYSYHINCSRFFVSFSFRSLAKLLKSCTIYLAYEADGDFMLVCQLNASSRFVIFVCNGEWRKGGTSELYCCIRTMLFFLVMCAYCFGFLFVLLE